MMIEEDCNDKRRMWFLVFVILLSMVAALFLHNHPINEIRCKGEAGHPDLYYYTDCVKDFWGDCETDFFDNIIIECKVGNHTLDKIEEEELEKAIEKAKELKKQRIDCFRAGSYYNFTFDLINDYNFSCEQIEYINNHLLLNSEKRSTGSIDSHYSGFISSHSIKIETYGFKYSE